MQQCIFLLPCFSISSLQELNDLSHTLQYDGVFGWCPVDPNTLIGLSLNMVCLGLGLVSVLIPLILAMSWSRSLSHGYLQRVQCELVVGCQNSQHDVHLRIASHRVKER